MIPSPPLEKRTYGPDSIPSECLKIKEYINVYENNVILYHELPVVSLFTVGLFKEKLNDIFKNGERFFFIIDLTNSERPNAEERDALRDLFKFFAKSIIHVTVYVGNNFLLKIACKFVLGTIFHKKISVHSTLKESLLEIETLRGQTVLK